MEAQLETNQDTALLIQGVKSKKDIEILSAQVVSHQMEEGLTDPLAELVTSTKMIAWHTARASAFRPYALSEMNGEKERGVLGSKVSKSTEAGRWSYADNYLEILKAEIKTVEAKAQKKDKKDRVHITLEGEEIFIEPAVKSEGGETVKVLL